MFLVDRPSPTFGLRADLAPRQLFGGAGDLVQAALVARPPVTGPAAPLSRRPDLQRETATRATMGQRKAG